MIALIRDDVESHRKIVPWVDDLHVEQDLLLSLAMVALFEDKFLKEHIAMRGGTALHKIHLAPPTRYSEDIDLVVITDCDEKHIAAGLKRVLRPILGERVNSLFDKAALQIRNLFRQDTLVSLPSLEAVKGAEIPRFRPNIPVRRLVTIQSVSGTIWPLSREKIWQI